MFREFLWTWVPWIFNKANDVFSKSKSMCRAVYNEAMVKKEWIFIKNIAIPVSSEKFGSIDNNNIKWRCSLFPTSFSKPGTLEKEKHLSYLGFAVNTPEEILDLSEWVNEVKWKGTDEPSLREIFILWCCEKGRSYFHCLDVIQVDLITEMGDTLRVPL
uniref:Uncharacterized protein n=1 Tax=viral metagenome TaxID=1070528 RepID=A0A6C0AN75_9ZZZZ